jgi:hypothetical protein
MTTSAAQNLGVGFRRPCREQKFGGINRAMKRIAPARQFFQRGGWHHNRHAVSQSEARFYFLAQQRFLLSPSLGGGRLCSKVRAPHRSTFLGPFVCGAGNVTQSKFRFGLTNRKTSVDAKQRQPSARVPHILAFLGTHASGGARGAGPSSPRKDHRLAYYFFPKKYITKFIIVLDVIQT